MVLGWLNFRRRNQAKRLEQYLEAERHEWMDGVEHYRSDRLEKERRIDLALHHEHREGSNWLENREIRMSDMVIEHERALIAPRIGLRRRLALECSDMLSRRRVSEAGGVDAAFFGGGARGSA